MAAEGATYSDPTNIQYKCILNATVRGCHNRIVKLLITFPLQ